MEARQLVAIVFTDIIGYTSIMGKNEQAALDLLEKNRTLHKESVHNFDGKWLKEIGDGTLLIFNSALDAVKCALEIHRRAQKITHLNLKVGIHVGDVAVRDNDIYGDGVNITSRLCELSESKGILISDSVYKSIRNQNIECKFLGEKTLKNVNEPVRVHQVISKDLDLTPQLDLTSESVSRRGKRIPVKTLLILTILFFTGWKLIDFVIDEFLISPYWSNLFLVFFLTITPSILLYVWQEYERKSATQSAKITTFFASNGIITLVILIYFFSGKDLGFITQEVTITTESGEKETSTVLKSHFVDKILFMTPNAFEDSVWASLALFMGMEVALSQYDELYLTEYWWDEMSVMEKINYLQQENLGYLVEGGCRLENDTYKASVSLYDSKYRLIDDFEYQNSSFLDLVDSCSMWIMSLVKNSPLLKDKSYLSVKEIATRDEKALIHFAKQEYLQAVKSDSTFGLASLAFCINDFDFGSSSDHLLPYINSAMRYRNRLPVKWEMLTRGYYYLISDQEEKAFQVFNNYTLLRPADLQFSQIILWIYGEFNRLDLAKELYERMQSNHKLPLEIQHELFWDYIHNDQTEIAEAMLGTMYESFSYEYHYYKGELKLLQGEYQTALTEFENASLLMPDNDVIDSLIVVANYYLKTPDSTLRRNLKPFAGFYNDPFVGRETKEIRGLKILRMNGGWLLDFLYLINDNSIFWSGSDTFIIFTLENNSKSNPKRITVKNKLGDKWNQWKLDSSLLIGEELFSKGLLDSAKYYFLEAQRIDTSRFWIEDYISHIDFVSNSDFDSTYLFEYVGDYDNRQISFYDGKLLYERSGNPAHDLYPSRRDWFFLLNSINFRLHAVREDDEINGLQGLYYNFDTEIWEKGEDDFSPKIIQ